MTLTIDIPEKAIRHAAEVGVPVEDLVVQAVGKIGEEPIPSGFVRLGTPTKTAAEAAASIREIASRHTLGNLNVRDLIDEGRRT